MQIKNDFDINKIRFIQQQLIIWYSQNGRSFLWRNKSATNYQLIISEVFLQRTKAETVNKFLPISRRMKE